MAPNGYLIGSHKKLRAENTREHTRFQIDNGTCLLLDPSRKSTFSAEVIDVSQGGLKLVTKVEPPVLANDTEPTILKILGHTLDESPVPLTKDFIRIVWKNDQVFGCSFIHSTA
jgi:hypothetical protein